MKKEFNKQFKNHGQAIPTKKQKQQQNETYNYENKYIILKTVNFMELNKLINTFPKFD